MAAKPRNILLDLQPLDDFGAFVADREGNTPPVVAPVLADVCADITAGVFQVTQLDGTALDCTITFDKKSGRYAVASALINASVEFETVPRRDGDDADRAHQQRPGV